MGTSVLHPRNSLVRHLVLKIITTDEHLHRVGVSAEFTHQFDLPVGCSGSWYNILCMSERAFLGETSIWFSGHSGDSGINTQSAGGLYRRKKVKEGWILFPELDVHLFLPLDVKAPSSWAFGLPDLTPASPLVLKPLDPGWIPPLAFSSCQQQIVGLLGLPNCVSQFLCKSPQMCFIYLPITGSVPLEVPDQTIQALCRYVRFSSAPHLAITLSGWLCDDSVTQKGRLRVKAVRSLAQDSNPQPEHVFVRPSASFLHSSLWRREPCGGGDRARNLPVALHLAVYLLHFTFTWGLGVKVWGVGWLRANPSSARF